MANIYRYKVLISGWTGGPGINTFYAKFPGDVSGADATDFASQLMTMYTNMASWLVGGHKAQVDNTIDVVDDVTGDTQSQISITPPGPATSGSAGATTLSRATMIKLRYRTGVYLGGREIRGGNYLGPINGNAILGDGSIHGNVISGAPGAFGGLLDILGPGRLVVWQRPRDADPANGITARGGSSAFVQNVSVNPLPGVIRSRRD